VLTKDKIKFIVLAVLVVLLITVLMLVGKESPVMKYVSGFCLAAWIITMFVLNKKDK